ncbi:hypothetical protein GCM10010232_56430 [Streptomyces amakusaensis]
MEAGLVAVAAAKAVDTARKRVTEYLLAARLEQLREQATARTEQVPCRGPAARTCRAPAARRHGRGGDRVAAELSRVDLARRPPGCGPGTAGSRLRGPLAACRCGWFWSSAQTHAGDQDWRIRCCLVSATPQQHPGAVLKHVKENSMIT